MVAGGRSTPGFSFPYDAVFGVDLDDVERPQSMWVPGQGRFVGEPVWIAPTGSTEDGLGWVVVMVYDGAAGVSSLCVLDPSSLASGPVARVDLPLMPHGFHGFGVSA
jgi:carotenoid cleavage dioxygenase-like enzyme